ERAREIFLHAVGRVPPEQWEAYVAKECAGDTDLTERVAALLRAHRESDNFLAQPFAGLAQTEDIFPNGTHRDDGEFVGGQLGSYKLLEVIGEGGMGTVWMGETTDARRALW